MGELTNAPRIEKLNSGVYRVMGDEVLGWITRWRGSWYVSYDLEAKERIIRKKTKREAEAFALDYFDDSEAAAIRHEEAMQRAMQKAHERAGSVVLDEYTTESGAVVQTIPFTPLVEEDFQ